MPADHVHPLPPSDVVTADQECILLCLWLRCECAIAIGKMQKGENGKKPTVAFWRTRISRLFGFPGPVCVLRILEKDRGLPFYVLLSEDVRELSLIPITSLKTVYFK